MHQCEEYRIVLHILLYFLCRLNAFIYIYIGIDLFLFVILDAVPEQQRKLEFYVHPEINNNQIDRVYLINLPDVCSAGSQEIELNLIIKKINTTS